MTDKKRKSERIKLRKSIPSHRHGHCPCCDDGGSSGSGKVEKVSKSKKKVVKILKPKQQQPIKKKPVKIYKKKEKKIKVQQKIQKVKKVVQIEQLKIQKKVLEINHDDEEEEDNYSEEEPTPHSSPVTHDPQLDEDDEMLDLDEEPEVEDDDDDEIYEPESEPEEEIDEDDDELLDEEIVPQIEQQQVEVDAENEWTGQDDDNTKFNEFQLIETHIEPPEPTQIILQALPSTPWLPLDTEQESHVTTLEPAPWSMYSPVNDLGSLGSVPNESHYLILEQQWEPEVERISSNSQPEQTYQIVLPPPPPTSTKTVTVTVPVSRPSMTPQVSFERSAQIPKVGQKQNSAQFSKKDNNKEIKKVGTAKLSLKHEKIVDRIDHVNVLVGDDPTVFIYECTVCQKKFKTKAHIKYHRFCSEDGKQEMEMPFRCDQCQRGFISRGHYDYHVKTHKNIKKKN